jgi:RNA polymerase sigma-70 factor (sigma-E family)
MLIIAEASATGTGDAAEARQLLGSLYSAHFKQLVRAAALLLGRADEAEEIVQEAFVRTLKAWARLQDLDRAESYLRSATLNLARSRIRRWVVVRRRALPTEATHPSAEEHAVLREEHRTVIAELRRLPKRQRECLVMRYYLDLPESEVAGLLGVSIGSVKTHTHRGIERMRKAMEAS